MHVVFDPFQYRIFRFQFSFKFDVTLLLMELGLDHGEYECIFAKYTCYTGLSVEVIKCWLQMN